MEQGAVYVYRSSRKKREFQIKIDMDTKKLQAIVKVATVNKRTTTASSAKETEIPKSTPHDSLNKERL